MSDIKNQKAFDDLSKVAEHLKNFMKEDLKDNQEFLSAHFENVNMLTGVPALSFSFRYLHTAKTGRETMKTRQTCAVMNYNPFTGEPFYKDSDGLAVQQ